VSVFLFVCIAFSCHFLYNIRSSIAGRRRWIVPAAVPITYSQFCEIERWCRKHGGVEMGGREAIRMVYAYGLVRRRRIILEGEVGFKFFENGLIVKVWTSCLRSEVEKCRREPLLSADVIVSRPPGEDMGWIVITNEFNRAQYFARPTLRTKNFVKTFIQRAGITIRKVQRRPLCEKCGKWMIIFRKASRATFWACFHRHLPRERRPTPFWKGWDFALTARMKAIVVAWRREFHRYLEAQRENGHTPRPAAQIRNAWVSTRDPNP